MNRLDLIIDALNSFTQRTRTVDMKSGTRRMCCGDPIEEKHTQHCIGLKALAAAREIRDLKPVAYIENHKAGQNLSWSQDDLPYAKATSLYALDEVKHD